MSEILIITAADLDAERRQAVHGRFEHALLSIAGKWAERGRPGTVWLQIHFPGEPEGGMQIAVRRPWLLSRWLWWLSGRGLGFGR